MVTMAGERVFIDTNVLVYATRPSSGMQRQAAKALQDLEDGGAELCISRQIIREYLATVTHLRPRLCRSPLLLLWATRKCWQKSTTFLKTAPL